mgnify:CR=1 FL=1
MEQLSKFTTPLPLSYAAGGKVENIKELDLSMKDQLIGIQMGRFILSLTQDRVSWYNAYWMIEQNCLMHKTPRLPDETDCLEMVRHVDLINATLQILKEYDIRADLLDVEGIYWLRKEYSHVKAFAYMMKDRLNTLREKFDDDSCWARMIWYN